MKVSEALEKFKEIHEKRGDVDMSINYRIDNTSKIDKFINTAFKTGHFILDYIEMGYPKKRYFVKLGSTNERHREEANVNGDEILFKTSILITINNEPTMRSVNNLNLEVSIKNNKLHLKGEDGDDVLDRYQIKSIDEKQFKYLKDTYRNMCKMNNEIASQLQLDKIPSLSQKKSSKLNFHLVTKDNIFGDINMSVRLYNILKGNRYIDRDMKISELENISRNKVLSSRNMGRKTIDELDELCRYAGIKMKI